MSIPGTVVRTRYHQRGCSFFILLEISWTIIFDNLWTGNSADYWAKDGGINRQSGVSPNTFHALMERAGVNYSTFPVFENKDDFTCFINLKHARFHLKSWQLELANESLNSVESLEWNHNRYIYQEWLLFESMLLFRTYTCPHSEILELLETALHISLPKVNLHNFNNMLLSVTELEIIISIAQEAFYLNEKELCFIICSQIERCLAKCSFSAIEKNNLLAEYAVIFSKYLLQEKDFTSAYNLANKYRLLMIGQKNDEFLLELTFLTALADYHLSHEAAALKRFKDAYYSALAIESNYATVISKYLKENLNIYIHYGEYGQELPHFNSKKIIDYTSFSDGIYSDDDINVLTIGKLIHESRLSQKISQTTLCQGLCSKSKLSKIESGTLQPKVLLVEALLQRLGFSEREFTFWGSPSDQRLFEIKYSLLYSDISHSNDTLLNELLEYDIDNSPLLKQLYLLFHGVKEADIKKRIVFLKEALDLTLPNFDINQLNRYRLSWAEITILNNIAYAYRYTDSPLHGIDLSRKILDYYNQVFPDLINMSHFVPHTLYQYARSLCMQENHKELVNLCSNININILHYCTDYLGGFYFYVCQSFGFCSENELLKKYAVFTVALQNLHEHTQNSLRLIL